MKQFVLLLSLFSMTFTLAARDFSQVEITVKNARANVYMLEGQGGNIGLLATEEGLLMIDNQFKPLAEKIESAMKSVVDKKIKYIVNTHFHGDHTGGNTVFSSTAPIFAHNNVRTRLMAKDQHTSAALPVVTYENGVTIHLADEEITLSHLPHGHTDGDTYVYFAKANVLHTGDLFFNGRFPYIDLKSGGTVKGYLNNVRAIIKSMPSDVIIIPGHGELTDLDGLKAFEQMLTHSVNRVSAAITEGKTEEEVVAMGIGTTYRHLAWKFITEDKWMKTLYKSLI